ncbi:MAG: hypothetical protein RSF40_09605 [Oscillospiraceae bacterium]
MKIKSKFKQLEPDTFVVDYLLSCGVADENIVEFIKPTGKFIEPPENYDNMKKAYKCLMNTINPECAELTSDN